MQNLPLSQLSSIGIDDGDRRSPVSMTAATVGRRCRRQRRRSVAVVDDSGDDRSPLSTTAATVGRRCRRQRRPKPLYSSRSIAAACDACDHVLNRVSTPFSQSYFCGAILMSKLLYNGILTNVQAIYTRDGQSRHPPAWFELKSKRTIHMRIASLTYYPMQSTTLPKKNSLHVGPSVQAADHGSYLYKSACFSRDTPYQILIFVDLWANKIIEEGSIVKMERSLPRGNKIPQQTIRAFAWLDNSLCILILFLVAITIRCLIKVMSRSPSLSSISLGYCGKSGVAAFKDIRDFSFMLQTLVLTFVNGASALYLYTFGTNTYEIPWLNHVAKLCDLLLALTYTLAIALINNVVRTELLKFTRCKKGGIALSQPLFILSKMINNKGAGCKS
ncbi:hypothetical protein Y032_0144g2449 [Ancylostoma ceylanicum]|uniref:7TM GPCR serpentine receptor class x (Srx) domain-containing protein n=1 Tax=Ancylostoma ceylanicum TaxID=53326 RepID=A0A016T2R0_9BILA|nr:hypothetical protein Y032_0144g2449 [Ancylostoma ceylanicum]